MHDIQLFLLYLISKTYCSNPCHPINLLPNFLNKLDTYTFNHVPKHPFSLTSMEVLEQLLLDSVSGDQAKMTAAISQFDALVASDVSALYSAFCEIILKSANHAAVSIAIVDLTQLIKSSWDKINAPLRSGIVDFMTQVFKLLRDEDIYIFAQLFYEVSVCCTQDLSVLLPFFENMGESEKASHFLVELLAANVFVPPEPLIQRWMDGTVRFTLGALKGTVSHYKCRAIRAIAMALQICPDQVERFTEHFEILKVEMKNSLTVSDKEYEEFWKSCLVLFESSGMPDEEFEEYGFADLIFAAAERSDIVIEMRLLPLQCFHKVLPYMTDEHLAMIAPLCASMGANYAKQTGDMPTDFVFFYSNCFDYFDHAQIYQGARELIIKLMESGVEENMVVAMCAVHVLIEKVPSQLQRDIDFITTYVENGLRHQYPLLIEISCRIIAAFPKFFATSLVDVGVFLPLIVYLLIHPVDEVRFKAAEALHWIFKISPVPCPMAVKMLFAVADRVRESDQLRFLILFGYAIEAQMMIEDDEAQKLVEFFQKLVTSNCHDRIVGALMIAVKTLKCTDNMADALVPTITKILDEGLGSENLHWRAFAIWVLGEFLKVDKKSTLELFYKHKDAIVSIFEMPDEALAPRKEYLAIEVSHVNATTEDHPLSDIMFDLGKACLENPETSIACSGLKILKRGALYRPDDQIQAMVRLVAEKCCQTKDLALSIRCVKTLGYIVRQARESVRPVCVALAYQVCLSFMRGEMALQNGVPPMGTDINFDLMRELAKQSVFWMDKTNPLQREIVKFSIDTFSRRTVLKVGLAFRFWGDVLKWDGFLPEEVQKIKEFSLSFLVEDINIPLIMQNAYLLQTLVSHGHIEHEDIHSKWTILIKWWNKCSEGKHTMWSALANVQILMLTVLGRYNHPLSTVRPVLIQTILNHIPPDDVQRTDEVVRMLVILFKQEDIPVASCVAAVRAICRLLICPEAILIRKRKVSPELKQELIAVVDNLRARDEAVQQAIVQFIHENPGRKERLAHFVQ